MRATRAPILLVPILLFANCSRSDAEVDRLLESLQRGERDGRQLAELGPDSADGIPAILAVMARDERRFMQTTCLEALLSIRAGDEARATVEAALQHRDAQVADVAALVAWKLYNRQDDALDRLVRRAPTELGAWTLLARAPPISDALAADLARDADLAVLAALGSSMKPALPRIERALKSDAVDQRISAAHAHFRVTGEVEPAMTVLVPEFAPDNLFLRQRIYGLWSEMLRQYPDAMRAELEKLRKHESEAVRGMATQMLGE